MRVLFAIIILIAGAYYTLSSDGLIADRWNCVRRAKPPVLPMTCGLIVGIVIGVLLVI